MNRGLGRVHVPDDRDRLIWRSPLRIDPASVSRRYRYWSMGGLGSRLDQGQTPHCVGFAATALLISGPITQPTLALTNDYANALYYEVKRIDGEPGAEDGSSVRSAMKALVGRGLVSEYLFAHDLESTILNVLERGPVDVGSDWYNSMFNVVDGFVRLNPSSGIAGGHSYILTGVNLDERYFRLLNSWGPSWGFNGHAFISFADMERLIADQGEIALAVERRAV